MTNPNLLRYPSGAIIYPEDAVTYAPPDGITEDGVVYTCQPDGTVQVNFPESGQTLMVKPEHLICRDSFLSTLYAAETKEQLAELLSKAATISLASAKKPRKKKAESGDKTINLPEATEEAEEI